MIGQRFTQSFIIFFFLSIFSPIQAYSISDCSSVFSAYTTQPMRERYLGENLLTYLKTPEERAPYRIVVRENRLFWLDGVTPVDTDVCLGRGAIFVMDCHGSIYISLFHRRGEFHHSSFLAGAPVAAAGEVEVENGVIQSISNRSGHYQTDVNHFKQVIAELQKRGIELRPSQIEIIQKEVVLPLRSRSNQRLP